ncbi:hypothetical protein [uncultured Desulfosarcina sp.]|uniref:hypothetical protein n=1 Tax=uncultured Desulfosarcina sp. TaxID=218289 RepID=UPI0029C6F01B|nr:hypothetical protein [uncultured Desulfosarcina sp.]
MSFYEVYGCAAFGFGDQALQVEGNISEPTFYLADAVLPTHPSGKIRTGEDAEEERIHSGLSWPPEARISRKAFMRRAPIPCVWNGLVEAGDRVARWKVGQGVSFTLNRIIALHIVDLLQNAGFNRQDMAVLAIPDALDEFGQDALLRELKIAGFANIQLLWRPVAAAISWLSEIDQNEKHDLGKSPNEHIVVVYLGPDGVEMTTFGLCREDYDGTEFVIPVRERPTCFPTITGFDWAANAIEAFRKDMDDGAFWQAFTNFPHIWEAISGRRYSKDRIVWSFDDHWSFWNPGEKLREHVFEVSSKPNARLRETLSNSCSLLGTSDADSIEPVGEKLAGYFLSVLKSRSKSRLRGILVTGSLCPPELPSWIFSASNELRSLGVAECSKKPKTDAIWLAHSHNALVDGCAEYGRRLDMGLPTYLDTLPQLAVLVEMGGEHKWIDLLKSETCKGGKPFKPPSIRNKFAIQANTQRLQVFLKKGEVRKRGFFHPEIGNIYDGVTRQTFRDEEILATVQHAGSYEKVLELFPQKESDGGAYARKIASEMFGNPFRRAEFSFPTVPVENMPVNISVEIRPASGLAQITLEPSNADDAIYLRGREIFLDYSTMEETDPPPQPTLGWPDSVKIEVDPDATFSRACRWSIEKYLQANPDDFNILNLVEDVKWALTYSIQNYANYRPINQDGAAGTEEASRLIDMLAKKASIDFPAIGDGLKRKFISRLSWLYAKTPENIRTEVRKNISQGYYNIKWNEGVEAAGRIFINENDLKLLYKEVYKRIRSNHNTPFPIQSYRALWRVLSLREKSPLAMARKQAEAFCEESVKMMRREANTNRYKQRFFQAAGLFLFILRFRQVDRGFLDPDNLSDSGLFKRAIECLRAAEDHFSRSHEPGADRAKELVIGIEKFMRFEGSNDILTSVRP